MPWTAAQKGIPTVDPAVYRIRVRSHLRPLWSEWFDGMAIENQPDGSTVLVGPLPDQAALHGVLVKVRDLGLTLLSVNRSEDI